MERIIRIAITGPESTGKSTIARQLAEYYKTVWVTEYARIFIDQLNRPYHLQDLKEIADGQIAQEKILTLKANRFLFCDTDLTVLKIWSEYKFGTVDPQIISSYHKINYDLYLLSDIDLPWKFDKQREHPEKRKFFFDWFEKELIAKKSNYKIISGHENERFDNARSIIEKMFCST